MAKDCGMSRLGIWSARLTRSRNHPTIVNTARWQFENLVREYVAGRVDWETVHQYALRMECENNAEFLFGQDPLRELHLIFLVADAKDDAQFRADRVEITGLLSRIDAVRPPIQ
jgi:hypothetical protein